MVKSKSPQKNQLPPGIVYRRDSVAPVGKLIMQGQLDKARDPIKQKMRVLGSYAIVYLYEGSGIFHDANGIRRNLVAGDLCILFPEIAHRYGPRRGEVWSEFFVVFDGPVFDLWRQANLLNPEQPIHQLQPVKDWLHRFQTTLQPMRPSASSEQLGELCRFLEVLSEAVTQKSFVQQSEDWLERATKVLEADLEKPVSMREVAAVAGLSYESFRKKFKEATSESPARYRNAHRMQAAKVLLENPDVTLRAIALHLGFTDEYHFSNQFKKYFGESPRSYRAR